MSNAPATTATPNNPFVGKTLGERYKIERLIGRGGMGLVHLAKESKHGREVVIKMLAPHWADDKNAIARFEREGLRLAQLTHPNIVELFDIGHEDGQSYIVMEFIRGEPLRRFLARRERLTLAEFVPIADQILGAVGYAHSRQMMLRDIKPSNIMLTEHAGKSNFVKMLDFGLAKLVDGDDVEITKAHVIGTAGYLAPEQIKGEACDVRVDVYALGILFFVMLAGTSPILGENDGAVLYNHVHGTPLELSAVLGEDHGIPESLAALIRRCMEKDPKKRPRNASEVAEVLRTCVPAAMFELPKATKETTEAIEQYWESKFNPVADDDEEKPTSAEWTRPHLRKLLESGGKDPAALRDGPPKPPKKLAKARKATARKTHLGLPSVAEAELTDKERRPKPAKTPARARMDAPTQMMESRGKPIDGASRRPPPLPEGGSGSTLTGAPRPVPPSPSAALGVPPPRPRKPTQGMPIPKALQQQQQQQQAKRDPDIPTFKPPVTRMPPVVADAPRASARMPAAPPPLTTPLQPVAQSTLEHPVHEPRVDPALLSQSVQVAAPLLASAAISAPIIIDEPDAPRRPTAAIIVVSVILATALGGMVAYLLFGDGSSPDTSTVAEASAAESSSNDSAKAERVDAAAESEKTTATPDDPKPDAQPIADADLGKLPVSGPDGATLYVDGEKVGPLPTNASLEPGKHTLSVEADGYLPWEQEVEVSAGDNPELVAELEPQPGARGKLARKNATARTTTTPKSKPSSSSGSGATPASTSSSPPPKSNATPEPFSQPSKPAAPTTPSKPPPSTKDDDVFIKPGSKGKTKDDGIFLPVGKGQ